MTGVSYCTITRYRGGNKQYAPIECIINNTKIIVNHSNLSKKTNTPNKKSEKSRKNVHSKISKNMYTLL